MEAVDEFIDEKQNWFRALHKQYGGQGKEEVEQVIPGCVKYVKKIGETEMTEEEKAKLK